MKKIFRTLAMSMLLALMSAQLCYAAEKQDMVNKMPEQVEVDGGVLELLDTPSVLSVPGIARYQYRVKTDGSNLNVRSGPGTNYSIVGKFANGTIVDIPFMQPSDIGDSWWYAYGNDANTGKSIEGYVHRDYIYDIE